MIRLALVLLAYLLVYLVDTIDVQWYYLTYFIAYALISIISANLCLKTDDRVLLCYATVCFFTSTFHAAVHFGYYNQLSSAIWNDFISLSLIVSASELILFIAGIYSVSVYLCSKFSDYNNQRQSGAFCVGKS